MKVSRFVVNPFGVNTYIMWAPESREAAIVDPGMTDDAEFKAVESFIEPGKNNKLKKKKNHNTH